MEKVVDRYIDLVDRVYSKLMVSVGVLVYSGVLYAYISGIPYMHVENVMQLTLWQHFCVCVVLYMDVCWFMWVLPIIPILFLTYILARTVVKFVIHLYLEFLPKF
jgi:hypothetical protein